MSDIVERLRSVTLNDAIDAEREDAADEIELLRTRIAEQYENGEASVTADIECHLNEHCGQPDDDDRSWTEYTRWMWARIAELEDDKAFWKNPPNGVWVEKDQIDKAWALASYRGEEDPVPERMLKELGIVRCEECEGSGVHRSWDFHPNEKPHEGQTCSACESCNGRGWVKHE